MGIFSRQPKGSKIHATKAGRLLADVQRESQKKNKDELAKRRDAKKSK